LAIKRINGGTLAKKRLGFETVSVGSGKNRGIKGFYYFTNWRKFTRLNVTPRLIRTGSQASDFYYLKSYFAIRNWGTKRVSLYYLGFN
jgi:hypothetical protein